MAYNRSFNPDALPAYVSQQSYLSIFISTSIKKILLTSSFHPDSQSQNEYLPPNPNPPPSLTTHTNNNPSQKRTPTAPASSPPPVSYTPLTLPTICSV